MPDLRWEPAEGFTTPHFRLMDGDKVLCFFGRSTNSLSSGAQCDGTVYAQVGGQTMRLDLDMKTPAQIKPVLEDVFRGRDIPEMPYIQPLTDDEWRERYIANR